MFHVAERERRSVGERPPVARLVPLGFRPHQPLFRQIDERAGFLQHLERSSKDQSVIVRNVDVLEGGHQERDRLTATGRAAVHRLAIIKDQELGLLRREQALEPVRYPGILQDRRR